MPKWHVWLEIERDNTDDIADDPMFDGPEYVDADSTKMQTFDTELQAMAFIDGLMQAHGLPNWAADYTERYRQYIRDQAAAKAAEVRKSLSAWERLMILLGLATMPEE